MKTIHIFLITIAFWIQSISLLQAQTTEGKEFWVTFGNIVNIVNMPMHSGNIDYYDMRIRIVGGNERTSGTIYFTNLNTTIPFDIEPYEIYTYYFG